MREVRHDGQDAPSRGNPSGSSSARLNSESPTRQIAPRAVRQQLAAAVVALADELVVHAEEVLGRRDVVVHEHHPARQRERRARRARAEREVVDEQVVLADLVHHVAVVHRQVLEPRIGGFDDDLGLEAGGAQGAADAEDLVADRVAVAQRRENLVDARPVRAAPVMPAPARAGTASTTRRAGGTRPRAAARTSPGSGSIAGAAGSRLSRSNMSRYFALDDRPGVVAPEELAPVAAENAAERPAGLERVQRFGELLERLVVQARVAAHALAAQHVARGRWPARACRAPTPRARPSTGSRSATA